MNSIGKIGLHFKGENETFFHALYGSWDGFYTKNIESPTNDIMMQFDDAAIELELDTIELDLGYISEENFTEQFTVRYREKLAETLQRYLLYSSGNYVKRIPKGKKLSEILYHFLLYGSLLWNVESKYKDINYLFLEVVSTEGAALKQFLLTYGHYSSLQQRLVFQLDDNSLKIGVQLIAPGESNFIISYVHFLQSKYKQLERPVIKESAHRIVIWEVIYAYLLTNQSSFFNKKSFIKYTVRGLSARHNMSYEHLLKIIAIEIETKYKDVRVTSELYSILNQLKSEIPKQVLEGTLSVIAKVYRVLAVTQHRNQKQWNDNKKILTGILKNEDSCRKFLQYLEEKEIYKLLEIVMPNDHVFAREYAKSLDRQKGYGVLQGKASGEFRLLKWKIIFPILLEGNTLNRKYFVMQTLIRVAAHYNLEIQQILIYFLNTEKEKLSLDKSLRIIFEELFLEIELKSVRNVSTEVLSDFKILVEYIRQNKVLSSKDIKQWKVLLSKAKIREKVLDELTSENEYQNFITMLFPEHSSLITVYSKTLDIYQKRKALEGKTGGKFLQLKWKFIHAVLFEPQLQVFNKKYFVSRVLFKIAAHYNLKSEELIVFFYKEMVKAGHTFLFELVKVLKELYEEQIMAVAKKHKNATIGNTETLPEQKARKRLEYYFGNDPVLTFFIDTLAKKYEFIEFIEDVLKAEMILRRSMIVEFGILPDIKQLLQVLMRFSGEYYSVSRVEIMQRILIYWFALTTKNERQIKLENKLQEIAQTNRLIKETLKTMNKYSEMVTDIINRDKSNESKKVIEMKKEILQEERLSTFVSNAGLVLLWPYLPRLFEMLSLTQDNKFKDTEARIRAIFVMQYAIFGMTEFAEHELEFNKILTCIAADTAIPVSVELTVDEKDIIDGLLKAVIQNWSKLGNTSIDGLRGNFLVRNGKLEEQDDFYQLTVETRAYDILLDSLPWSISTVKFSWMEKGINVKWR